MKKTKKAHVSLGDSIMILIIGILMGNVFTFGVSYWNAEVTKDECTRIETHFLSYRKHRTRRSTEISIDCTNGERYFIDTTCVNDALCDALSSLSKDEQITLLIHPNSNTIVELSARTNTLLDFDDTIRKLYHDATVFLFLGLFMYFCALLGLYYIALYCIRKRRRKK